MLSPRDFVISRYSHLLCLKPSPSLISMENSTGVSEQQAEFLSSKVSFVLGCPPGWGGPSRAKSCHWTPRASKGRTGAHTEAATLGAWPSRRGGARETREGVPAQELADGEGVCPKARGGRVF